MQRPTDHKTSYEQTARLLKVLKLSDLLMAHGITSDQVRELPLEGWTELAKHAKVHPPSTVTVDMIVTMMSHREQDPGRELNVSRREYID